MTHLSLIIQMLEVGLSFYKKLEHTFDDFDFKQVVKRMKQEKAIAINMLNSIDQFSFEVGLPRPRTIRLFREYYELNQKIAYQETTLSYLQLQTLEQTFITALERTSTPVREILLKIHKDAIAACAQLSRLTSTAN